MTNQATSSGLTRTQKEFAELLRESAEISQKIGQVIFGLGTNTAHIAIMPKQAASDLLVTAEQLFKLRDEVLDLANAVIDWEVSAIKAIPAKGLVQSDGRPL